MHHLKSKEGCEKDRQFLIHNTILETHRDRELQLCWVNQIISFLSFISFFVRHINNLCIIVDKMMWLNSLLIKNESKNEAKDKTKENDGTPKSKNAIIRGLLDANHGSIIFLIWERLLVSVRVILLKFYLMIQFHGMIFWRSVHKNWL